MTNEIILENYFYNYFAKAEIFLLYAPETYVCCTSIFIIIRKSKNP